MQADQIAELEKQQREWLAANSPNGWIDELRKEVEALRAERDCAVAMLAEWCVAVDTGGSDWDYWDESYKTAMYRLNPIRKLLDAAITAARAAQENV
jgi:hypothetical protein